MIVRRDRRVDALVLGLALTSLFGWLFKAHCMAGGWVHSIQYTTGCYSDAVPFWSGRNVDRGLIPYFQTRMEYPVLTGAQIWIEGSIARLLGGASANAATFLAVVTAANALLAGLILVMFRRAGMDRARLWLWAAAPPLVLYLGHNWDMGAIALAVAAMLAARNERPVLAAVLAALGAAAKLFPALMLPLIGLGALFAPGQGWRQRLWTASACTVAAIAAWAAVNLPVALAAPENWSEFYRFSQERAATAASVWGVLAFQGVPLPPVGTSNLIATLLFFGGAAAIVGLGWRRHRDRLWVLFTPVLAWFMLTNKVHSPQFDLWLYPMLVMTAPRLAPVLLYVIGDVCAYFAEFWLFAGMDGAWPYATPHDVMLAAAIRGVAMLWIIGDALFRPAPDWIGRATD